MFLNNTRLLVELEGFTDIRRKERIGLVEEFVVGMILERNAHKIQEIVDELLRRTHPNKITRGRIRMEALMTSDGKRNGNAVVAWTLGR